MTDTKLYVFDFVSIAPVLTTRVPISNMTIRRRRDSTAFCSVTIPKPQQLVETAPGVFKELVEVILNNLDVPGSLVISQIANGGVETVVGTYLISQIIPTRSASSYTVVLNGTADFATDLPAVFTNWVIDNPITESSDSNNLQRFSAAENALIRVDDTIDLEGQPVTVEEISLFVNVTNSRMDVGVI